MSKLSPATHRGRRQRIRPGWTDNPVGFAICDRCGLSCMHSDLRKDMQFRGGMAPVPTGLMVCGKCEDVPNAYFQKQILRPDPPPLKDPRPDDRGEGPAFLELQTDDDLVELQSGDGVVELETLDYPQYMTGTLPDPAPFPAGYQINVLGLVGSPVRAYADTTEWRRVDTDAVVT